MTAGSDIENGLASSLIDKSLFSLNRASKARRVGSAAVKADRSHCSFTKHL